MVLESAFHDAACEKLRVCHYRLLPRRRVDAQVKALLGEPKPAKKPSAQPRGVMDLSARATAARTSHRTRVTTSLSCLTAWKPLPQRKQAPTRAHADRPHATARAQATLPAAPRLDEEVEIHSAFALRAEELAAARARLDAAAEEGADLRLCLETVSAQARVVASRGESLHFVLLSSGRHRVSPRACVCLQSPRVLGAGAGDVPGSRGEGTGGRRRGA